MFVSVLGTWWEGVGGGGFGARKTDPSMMWTSDPWYFAHAIPCPRNSYTVAGPTLDPGPSLVRDKCSIISLNGAVALWAMNEEPSGVNFSGVGTSSIRQEVQPVLSGHGQEVVTLLHAVESDTAGLGTKGPPTWGALKKKLDWFNKVRATLDVVSHGLGDFHPE